MLALPPHLSHVLGALPPPCCRQTSRAQYLPPPARSLPHEFAGARAWPLLGVVARRGLVLHLVRPAWRGGRQWGGGQGKFSLGALLRLCGRIAKAQLGSGEGALAVAGDEDMFRYRFCRAVARQWGGQVSAGGESDAQESAPSTTQPIDPTSPTNPKFGWAMSLNRNAATTSLSQAASVLQTVAQKTAHSANAGPNNVQQCLRRVQGRIHELVSWATDIGAPNRGPCISGGGGGGLVDPRKARRAGATQTNVRGPGPKGTCPLAKEFLWPCCPQIRQIKHNRVTIPRGANTTSTPN